MATLKQTIALTLAAATLFSFTACGSSNKASSSSASKAVEVGSRDATLRFSWWGGDSRNKATLDVIKQFETKYPKVKIEAEYGSSDGYNDKLATQLSAGTAPDIVQMDPAFFLTYLKTNPNYFVDFKTQKIDLTGFDAQYLKGNGNYEDKQYGLPTGTAGWALIVNSDLASKIGVDLTKQYTFDDLLAMGAKVKSFDKDSYLLGANLATVSDELFRPYLMQLTGKVMLDDNTKTLGATKEQIAEALTFIKKLYDNGVIPPESHMSAYAKDNLPKDPSWISGKYVSAYCVASTINVLAAANKNANYVTGKLPVMKDAKNDGYIANTPQLMLVTQKSQYQPEAVAFLDYFFNDKDAAKALGIQRSIPAVKTAREVCLENNLIDKLTNDAVTSLLAYNAPNENGLSTASQAKSIYEDTISAIAFGKKDPATAAADMVTLLNNFLATKK